MSNEVNGQVRAPSVVLLREHAEALRDFLLDLEGTTARRVVNGISWLDLAIHAADKDFASNRTVHIQVDSEEEADA